MRLPSVPSVAASLLCLPVEYKPAHSSCCAQAPQPQTEPSEPEPEPDDVAAQQQGGGKFKGWLRRSYIPALSKPSVQYAVLGGTAALLAVAGVGISLIETGLDISGDPKPLASSLDLASSG